MSTPLRFDRLTIADKLYYERVKKVLDKSKHPGFVGREVVFRCAERGIVIVAVLDDQDVGVVLVDHKHTLGTLSVIPGARKHGVGGALVREARPFARFVKAIAERVGYFERLGYRPCGAPTIGAAGKMLTQLMERGEDVVVHAEGAPVVVSLSPIEPELKSENMNLEELLTTIDGFGLVTATPLQRAIARITEGRPLGDLAEHPDILQAIGSVTFEGRPAQIYICSGIRTAKSLFAAALALHASQTCDVDQLGPGEIPRVSIVSLDLDKAAVVLRDHVVGRIMASESLRKLLVDDPKRDSVVLRHPTGRPVEIKTVAGTRAGGSLVARWSAGAIFDEAPRMIGEDDAVVTFGEGRRAVLGRLLPGAQLIAIGSPWAPRGDFYDSVMEHWGKPRKELVVIRAAAPMMNPVLWTPERCEALRLTDEVAWRTDVCAEFVEQGASLFSAVELERAMVSDVRA